AVRLLRADLEVGAGVAAHGRAVEVDARAAADPDRDVAGDAMRRDASLQHRAEVVVAAHGVHVHALVRSADLHVARRGVDVHRPAGELDLDVAGGRVDVDAASDLACGRVAARALHVEPA